MTFRDQRPRCPHCPDSTLVPQLATRLGCEHCKGVLVPTAEIEDQLSQLRVEPFTLPAGVPGERTCPRCTTRMERLALFDIEVDRCEAHGVWFDGKELTSVLEAASGIDPRTIQTAPETKRGALGILRSLFGSRHGLPSQPRRPRDDD